MSSHPFHCSKCYVTLGQLVRKQDHRGRPIARLKLNLNVEHAGRLLFRGTYVACKCGEKVRVPDDVTVEFR